MPAAKKAIRFRFSTSKRPEYYAMLGDRYDQFCRKRGGKVLMLDREEQGAHLRVRVECANGHAFWVAGRHLMNGTWCPDCRKTDAQGEAMEQLQKLAVKRKGKLLSKIYANARTPLNWQCQHGHTWAATADNVSNKGSWCPECALEKLFAARDRAHRKRRAAAKKK